MNIGAKNYGAYFGIWAQQREQGCKPPTGANDVFTKSLYSSMSLCAQWDSLKDSNELRHGGIFNLEFSPEGSFLVAACEKNSILIVDPLTYKKIHYVSDAHTDCVNFVKFLDSNMFATCSDDTTVALWDIRNLRRSIRTLRGHSNWVKNIEYSIKEKLLVTSGLDGSIYTWDIHSNTESSFVYQRVFHAPGLMRCRISPDANQLVMCTTGGLLILVHKLDLNYLSHDLHGFKPNMYRLMQITNQHLPVAAMYNHLFDAKRKRNRVEFVSDFPKNNDAEVVSSLQIHPQGWCALSRNISHNDKSEWTCVHDIQENGATYEEIESDVDKNENCRTTRSTTRNLRQRNNTNRLSTSHSTRSSRTRPRRNATNRTQRNAPQSVNTNRVTSQNDVWEAMISIRQQRIRIDLSFRGEQNRSFHMQRITGISSGITVPINVDNVWRENPSAQTLEQRSEHPSPSSSTQRDDLRSSTSKSKKIVFQNKKRLLYYIQEPNVGQGFIKELCFSADGRLICSPYGYGVRLLSFNENCSELSTCAPEPGNATPLVEFWKNIYHDDYVVTAKFSPHHFMLATGCLSGRIIWYQPRA